LEESRRTGKSWEGEVSREEARTHEGRGKDAINDHRNGVGRKGAEAALEGGDCTLSHGGDGLAGAAAPEPDRRAEGGRTKTLLLFFFVLLYCLVFHRGLFSTVGLLLYGRKWVIFY
jgi:hypothetical protein